MSIAYGYNFTRHGSNIIIINAVSKRISVYTQTTNELIRVFENGDFDMELDQPMRLELELHDEFDGPKTLYIDHLGEIIDEFGENRECDPELFWSKTYPSVKLGRPTLCTCMIWTYAYDGDLTIFNETGIDVLEALNGAGGMLTDCAKIAYVCGKLGILDPKIEWDGRCCS